MDTLVTQRRSLDERSKEKIDPVRELEYINRILDILLTIPEEYWKPVTRTVSRWVEEGLHPYHKAK